MRRVICLIITMALMVVLLLLSTVASAASQVVTLSEGDSLADALAEVSDGGTIWVNGTVTVTDNLGTHGKTVVITGGTLDFSSLGPVTLGDHITFDSIILTFKENSHLYANGYKVKIGSGVTLTNPIQIFGGANGGSIASTDLTVLAGTYTAIYGGSYNGSVIGDTHLYVGGSTNASIDASSHSATNCIYGGSYIPSGYTQTIGGTAYTVFTGSAKANYIYGANNGNGTICGGVNIEMSGGLSMSIFGASRGGTYIGDVKLLISGGTVEQVFGGTEGGAVTGDVALDITGGTITRRVYGGCYNNYDGSWVTSHYVTGEIALTLHSGANITFSSSSLDRSIYAHSRHNTMSETEVSHLVFADSTAYSNYKNKVKAQDSTMRSIMYGVSAADYVHNHTYTADGPVITRNCIDSNCSASATVTVEGTPVYTGTAVKPAKVIYSGNWFGDELDIGYVNNTNIGTSIAYITCGGATASVDFAIVRPILSMNGEGYGSLEDAIAAARQTPSADTITLEQDVEVSTWLMINTDVTITADKAVTITAADSQTGSMIRIVGGGKLTIEGVSEDAKITLAAGANTAHVVVNNGGEVKLTNVVLKGNKNTAQTPNNKACGIFNNAGTVTVKNVDIADMVMGDGIFVMDGTTVNLDNVTTSGSGRYGIKVKGALNISNTQNSNHALSVSNTTDHAIDVENGGKVVCDFNDVSVGAYIIKLFDNLRKGLNVRNGGDATLLFASGEN